MAAEAVEVSNKVVEGAHDRCARANGCGAAVSVLAEMQGIVRDAGGPAVAGESVKAAIGRAARRLRLGYARTRAHWYGLARAVPAEEADRLRAARRAMAAERLAALEQEGAALRRWVAAATAASGGVAGSDPAGGLVVQRGEGGADAGVAGPVAPMERRDAGERRVARRRALDGAGARAEGSGDGLGG